MKLRIGWECLVAGFSQVHCAKVSNSPSEMEPQQPSHCMHGWVCVWGEWNQCSLVSGLQIKALKYIQKKIV